eukprot:6187554-Pleurochrysis_carterae.AAC.1
MSAARPKRHGARWDGNDEASHIRRIFRRDSSRTGHPIMRQTFCSSDICFLCGRRTATRHHLRTTHDGMAAAVQDGLSTPTRPPPGRHMDHGGVCRAVRAGGWWL